MNLSPKGALQWVKRLGVGLSQLGINKGDVILIFTPNHIFVPVAYLGIVGSGYVFSGANPSYTGQGPFHTNHIAQGGRRSQLLLLLLLFFSYMLTEVVLCRASSPAFQLDGESSIGTSSSPRPGHSGV